jgi:iron complex transport system permease protein
MTTDPPQVAAAAITHEQQLPGAQAPEIPSAAQSGALLLTLLLAMSASLALGSVAIPLGDVARILLGAPPASETWTLIVLTIRLPKTITAALSGAALAASGAQMQTLFRNPLADPYILGISSGASLGVAVVLLTAGAGGSMLVAGLGLAGKFGLITAASCGAAMVLGLVLIVAQRVQNSITLLIVGVMMSYLTSAIVGLLIYFSLPERVQAFSLWTMGSFAGVTWDQLRVFGPALGAGLLAALLMHKPLNALLLGDTYASTLGVHIKQLRALLIASTALLTGTVTAFCGPVGFLGVAVPHICRTLFRSADHRIVLPGSMLLGATTALIADLIAQLPGSQLVLPLNIVTSLFGVPVILWVIARERQLKSSFAA